MKRFLFSLAGIAACIHLASCGKGDSTTNPPVSNDSTILSRVIDFDTTKASGADTVTQAFFEYDNLKRIKKITYFHYYQSFTDKFVYDYAYTGTDTNAVTKTMDLSSVGNPSEVSRKTFVYDAAGKVISLTDSSGIYPVYPTYHVTKGLYSNNSAFIKNYSVTRTPYSVDSSYIHRIAFTKVNGNVTLQLDSFYNNATYGNSYSKFRAVYDFRSNPLFKFAEHPLLELPVPAGGHFFNQENYFQPNNIIDLLIEFYSGGVVTDTRHYTFNYEYNALNLPTICRQHNQPGLLYGIEYIKRKFFYTK